MYDKRFQRPTHPQVGDEPEPCRQLRLSTCATLLLFQHTRFFFLFCCYKWSGTNGAPSVRRRALLLLPRVFSCFSANKMDETVIVSIKNYITRSFFLCPRKKKYLLIVSDAGWHCCCCCCCCHRVPDRVYFLVVANETDLHS